MRPRWPERYPPALIFSTSCRNIPLPISWILSTNISVPRPDGLPGGKYKMNDPYEETYIETNGIRLHVVTAGDPGGNPLILLHGFPEFWYGWRHQMPALAQAGYFVIVPDQRGYNLSDKPARVND